MLFSAELIPVTAIAVITSLILTVTIPLIPPQKGEGPGPP
jgi:hypothetical protein